MSKLISLEDLFHHQLKDIYSAEKKFIDALPIMKEEASDDNLKQAFTGHLEEIKKHKKRLTRSLNHLISTYRGKRAML